MSIFIGTKKDFKKFFDGYCKQKVATMTKKEKIFYDNTCQYCGEKQKELDAAHVNGQERSTIIFNILDNTFRVGENEYKVDLDQFTKIYEEAHTPIEEKFHFLCKNCHRRYDKKEISEIQMAERKLVFLKSMLAKIRQKE